MYPNETAILHAILAGFAVFITLVIFFIITIRKYHRRKLELNRQKLKADLNNLDKERERIAFDLHDDLGSSLSTIKLNLQCMQNMQSENAAIVEDCQLNIDEIMQKLRYISFNLMPATLQRKGLDVALKELIDLMTHATNIIVNYHCSVTSFDKEKTIHIYRIAQEILNNIIRHAGAANINFTISQKKYTIELNIADNGKGFDKDLVIHKSGALGLNNIASRVDLLGAKMYLTTEKGAGTVYKIEIPQ